ncbi:MAG: hypothetical protein MEQ07_05905 [Aquimonas sp.]|nr:hypothetical protein [Aquimonas sp.]
MKNRVAFSKLASVCLLALATSPAVLAQSFSASNTTAVINTTGHVSTLTLNTNGVAIGGAQVVLNYNDTHLTAVSATSSDPNLTCNVAVAGRVSCGAFSPIAAVTTVTISFNVAGTEVVTPGSALVFDADPVTGSTYFDPGFDGITTALTNGSVTIITAPPDVTLSYAPAAGSTITFPTGVALTPQNASITVTGGGTVGSGTVTGCGITGPGAAAFGTPPADITVAAGATGTLPLTCTLPNTGGAATATLTCTETDSDTPAPGAPRTWNLSCPQGTPVPGPGYTSAPAPGSTLNCDGTPGGATTTSFTVSNNGNPGAGSDLTFTCTAAGAGFSIVSGGTSAGLAIGASQSVVVGCTPSAEGAPPATGTVSCTTNAGVTPTYNLSSTGVIVPPPVARPAIVPATSYWSQALLVLLLAGLGMAFVGFRRS